MRCPHHHWQSVLHPHRHPCLRPPQPLHLSLLLFPRFQSAVLLPFAQLRHVDQEVVPLALHQLAIGIRNSGLEQSFQPRLSSIITLSEQRDRMLQITESPYNLRLRQHHLVNLFLIAYILPDLQWRRFCFWRRSWQWRCIWGVCKNIITIADSSSHSFSDGFLLQLPLFLLPLPLQCPLLYLRPSHKLPPNKFLLKRLPPPLQLLLQNTHHSQKIASAIAAPDLSFPPFCCCYKATSKHYNISMDPTFSRRQKI